jgi:hypothetical protein
MMNRDDITRGTHMRLRILPAVLLAAALTSTANRAAADDPKLPDTRAFDKLVVDSLRDVHNKGADLYNASKDYTGAYRLYQGALLAVEPLLAHRPDSQKRIEAGLAAADKEPDASAKAFRLHETIEAVRKDLKAAIGEKKPDEPKKAVEPPKKPDEPKKTPEPPKKVEEPKKPAEPPKKVEEPKKVVEPPKKVEEPKKVEPPKKPAEALPVAPAPREAAPKGKAAPTAKASGVVTISGKPLAEGTLSLSAGGHTYTTAIKDGEYAFAEAIPAGKYAAAVTGKGVPEKYTSADTSGLTFNFAAGANTLDIELK